LISDDDIIMNSTLESRYISATDRQMRILDLIKGHGRISVADLCVQFAISEATARRDLDALAEEGLVERVHGGAIAAQRASPENPILRRTHEQEEEKRAIGQAAAALVMDGETVFLGSGTTVLAAAQCLADRNITVITNSLPIINLLSEQANIALIALGGRLRESELSFIGHITEQAVVELRADKVIIGTRALNLEQGLTNDYLPETLTDRAILKIGSQVIIAADHTKFGRIATAFLAPLKTIQFLVTDRGADAGFIAELEARGVKVILA
jgi:DeoR family transcriptional regulator, aga operon transcriptional repressor